MKISFTGDLCMMRIESFTKNPFKELSKELAQLNPVINLESIFLPSDYNKKPIKNKICLWQNNKTANLLKQLNPIGINLSNNHINDFGNYGASNTKKILKSHNLKFFGAGFEKENHNILVLLKEKTIILSYTTRSTDISQNLLFNKVSFIGPKEFSFNLYKIQTAKYPDFKKIVLFHWGVEREHYPKPQQRVIARALIDIGADLIIGNHAHVVQGYENYKNKYIFYALGNFLFPNIDFENNQGKYRILQNTRNKISILPVFKILEDSISLLKILIVKSNENFELTFSAKCKKYNLFLFNNMGNYNLFYKSYVFFRRIKRISTYPYRKAHRLRYFIIHKRKLVN